MLTEKRRYQAPGFPGTIAVMARLKSAGITATKITMWKGRSGQWQAETTTGARWVTNVGGWRISKVEL